MSGEEREKRREEEKAPVEHTDLDNCDLLVSLEALTYKRATPASTGGSRSCRISAADDSKAVNPFENAAEASHPWTTTSNL